MEAIAPTVPFSETNFPFGINLEEAVHYHLDLLEVFWGEPFLGDSAVIDRAIWRYEHLWLPLVAGSPDVPHPMIAPLDIQWVWHCHLLSPLAYERDCLKITGTLVDHSLNSLKDREKYLKKTQKLWKTKYHDQQFDICATGAEGVPEKFESQITYDLRGAMSRQRDFFYEVSLPHFRDKAFLAKGLERYRRFLYLRQQFPAFFPVPSYDIDLMWHTHQLYPKVYQRDTQTLLGRTFNHDDSVNDRSPGSKLSLADAETRDLWRNTFGEQFIMYGAMYRGEPSVGKLKSVEKERLADLATKSCYVYFNEIDIVGLHGNEKSRFKLDISMKTSDFSRSRDDFVRSNKPVKTLKSTDGRWSGGNLCELNTLHFDSVQFALRENKGRFCWISKEYVGYAVHDLGTVVNESYADGRVIERVVPLNNADGLKLKYRADLRGTKLGAALLNVTAGSYETCVMPETSEQMWGPVPLGRLLAGTDNFCEVASHRVIDNQGNLQFTCRTVHSLELLMSAVQVFYKDSMVVVGHLIGTEQLPLWYQVTKGNKKCVSLRPRVGERAILIKNSSGDWGILKGRWEGFRKGVAGRKATRHIPGKKGKPGSPGHLKVKLFKLGTKSWQSVKTGYESSDYEVTINGMAMNLMTGSIKCRSWLETPENLAVAFGLALLHVLCQPRPKIWKPRDTAPTSRGDRAIRYIPSEDMVLILAAGYTIYTPTNRFIYRRHYLTPEIDPETGSVGMGDMWTEPEYDGDSDINAEDAMDYDAVYGWNDTGEGDTNADGGGGAGGVGACGGCGGCGGGGHGGGGGCGGGGCGGGGYGGGGGGGCGGGGGDGGGGGCGGGGGGGCGSSCGGGGDGGCGGD